MEINQPKINLTFETGINLGEQCTKNNANTQNALHMDIHFRQIDINPQTHEHVVFCKFASFIIQKVQGLLLDDKKNYILPKTPSIIKQCLSF